ncbi:hypothetical protein TBLA_0B01760 [Henningerozyma blattae CBS 6284]|uniref:Chromatin modification-related protein n=1 Tax=Henningerozyma blattae (strain ATCC 34711 / CBS 6284 / DSM 70876 / NBRC 10599 / NRRL Y-10934 / UCD 77-7) TaxID=1071380 RepID=I2GY17_HENB6|nr:hypothetical protein TBLA_0B01760 [Tetrapisispora blattae CBS 6284]CCH59019.1 hypothetical protein TBLA_0B01760 [Tetrapisispora blattae CBS 6284]
MSGPANMYPGLNDIHDTLEEIPVETSRYLTLLHEIEAKCINNLPILYEIIDKLTNPDLSSESNGDIELLIQNNRLLEDNMGSLEEKMHVSAILARTLERLIERLELGYEVAIKNDEIPWEVRNGPGDTEHPSMHLHHELIAKALSGSGPATATQGAETRGREHHTTTTTGGGANTNANATTSNTANADAATSSSNTSTSAPGRRATKRRKVRATNSGPGTNTTTNANSNLNTSTTANSNANGATTTAAANSGANTNATTGTNPNLNSVSLDPNTQMTVQNMGTVNTPLGTTPLANTTTTTATTTTATTTTSNSTTTATEHPRVNEYGEPLYCYCQQVAYGEMVGCDGANCALEWFHLPCIGLDTLPRGKWYCHDCQQRRRKKH